MSFDNTDGSNKPMLTAIDFMILFGMDKDQAEFAAAIESGELESDLIMITTETTE